MTRNMSPDMIAEFSSPSVSPVLMGEAYFDSATLRMWSGYGTLEWNGEDFLGGGNFIGVSPIEETQELQAKGIVVTLSGIPSTLIAAALVERSRGRPFRLYLASVQTRRYVATENEPGIVLTEGGGGVLLENQLIDTPLRIFSGIMDTMEFTDNGEEATIRLSVENILIVGQRAKLQRYTDEDQRKRFPEDAGLSFINQLQDKEIVW